jgi:DNA-binding NarL/FixJ family response regulator
MGSKEEGPVPPHPVSPPRGETISVMIADDHALVREGTKQILERASDLRVVGEAERGDRAVELALSLRPDVVLMDLRLPALSGIAATEQILAGSPSTRVMILSAFDDEEYISEALQVGASGYLVKTIPSAELVDAVRRVHGGEVVLQPEMSAKLAGYMRRAYGRGDEPILSPRELEVLTLLAKGASNKEIARRLSISLRTVEGHLSNIFGKLGVSSRTEALVFAISHHLVEPVR